MLIKLVSQDILQKIDEKRHVTKQYTVIHMMYYGNLKPR